MRKEHHVSKTPELVIKLFSEAVMIPRFGFIGTSMTEPVTWVIMVVFLMSAYLIKRRELFRDSAD